MSVGLCFWTLSVRSHWAICFIFLGIDFINEEHARTWGYLQWRITSLGLVSWKKKIMGWPFLLKWKKLKLRAEVWRFLTASWKTTGCTSGLAGKYLQSTGTISGSIRKRGSPGLLLWELGAQGSHLTASKCQKFSRV